MSPEEKKPEETQSPEPPDMPEGFIDAATQIAAEDAEDAEYLAKAEQILAAQAAGKTIGK